MKIRSILFIMLLSMGCQQVNEIDEWGFDTDSETDKTYDTGTGFGVSQVYSMDTVPGETGTAVISTDEPVGCLESHGEARVIFDEYWDIDICCNVSFIDGRVQVYDYAGNAVDLDIGNGFVYLNIASESIPVKYRNDDFGVLTIEGNNFFGTLDSGIKIEGFWE